MKKLSFYINQMESEVIKKVEKEFHINEVIELEIKSEKILLEKNNNQIIQLLVGKWSETMILLKSNDKIINLISIYECNSVNVIEKRGMINIHGHETLHTIFIDDLEVTMRYTR